VFLLKWSESAIVDIREEIYQLLDGWWCKGICTVHLKCHSSVVRVHEWGCIDMQETRSKWDKCDHIERGRSLEMKYFYIYTCFSIFILTHYRWSFQSHTHTHTHKKYPRFVDTYCIKNIFKICYHNIFYFCQINLNNLFIWDNLLFWVFDD